MWFLSILNQKVPLIIKILNIYSCNENKFWISEVYRDRLKKQGIKGKKALREKIKEVRQKLTQKVNDLNRRKGGGGENSSSTSSTSSEESD